MPNYTDWSSFGSDTIYNKEALLQADRRTQVNPRLAAELDL